MAYNVSVEIIKRGLNCILDEFVKNGKRAMSVDESAVFLAAFINREIEQEAAVQQVKTNLEIIQ